MEIEFKIEEIEEGFIVSVDYEKKKFFKTKKEAITFITKSISEIDFDYNHNK